MRVRRPTENTTETANERQCEQQARLHPAGSDQHEQAAAEDAAANKPKQQRDPVGHQGLRGD